MRKKAPCHHPQGGFCDNCRAPGLEPLLTREQVEKIDTFAAHWVESSECLMGLALALRKAVETYVKQDRQYKADCKAGKYDYVPE